MDGGSTFAAFLRGVICLNFLALNMRGSNCLSTLVSAVGMERGQWPAVAVMDAHWQT